MINERIIETSKDKNNYRKRLKLKDIIKRTHERDV